MTNNNIINKTDGRSTRIQKDICKGKSSKAQVFCKGVSLIRKEALQLGGKYSYDLLGNKIKLAQAEECGYDEFCMVKNINTDTGDQGGGITDKKIREYNSYTKGKNITPDNIRCESLDWCVIAQASRRCNNEGSLLTHGNNGVSQRKVCKKCLTGCKRVWAKNIDWKFGDGNLWGWYNDRLNWNKGKLTKPKGKFKKPLQIVDGDWLLEDISGQTTTPPPSEDEEVILPVTDNNEEVILPVSDNTDIDNLIMDMEDTESDEEEEEIILTESDDEEEDWLLEDDITDKAEFMELMKEYQKYNINNTIFSIEKLNQIFSEGISKEEIQYKIDKRKKIYYEKSD